MGRLLDVVKWSTTLGKEPQNFLGAKWIGKFLDKVPESKKRIWALRLVSLSPHYFVTELPEHREMSNVEFLESAYESCRVSRVNIYEKLLGRHLEKDFVVLDYGCGPGFIAKVASEHVGKIYAIDISSGAIACAKVINNADNIEYLAANETGLNQIPDDSVDAVYSFAVIQHLTDEVFNILLRNSHRKLKKGGRLLLHIQMLSDIWKSQDDWEKDNSLKGRLKYNYGLHCFGRTAERHCEMVSNHGFVDLHLEEFKGFDPQYDEELKYQRLLTARK